MNERVLTLLGCGSAKPTALFNPSGQLLNLRNKQFLIDCGEGVQITLAQIAAKTAHLDHILISHLHGDHCFGLMGLLSTFGMLGRTKALHLYAQPDLERLMRPLLNYFCRDMRYEVVFHNYHPNRSELLYEDRTLTIRTLPLKHRVPCCGFLFEEKPSLPNILKTQIDRYHIPLAQIPLIKAGADFVTETGELVPNALLVRQPAKPFRYAYCSDTAYDERLVAQIEGVDCLYHEATYPEEWATRAAETMHSTARQAATIALKAKVGQLIIGHYSSRIKDFDALLQEAQAIFPNTVLGKDKLSYSF